jgi:hypothetical protein
MFQYRQVLVRLRAGDTARQIARSGLMGRDKAGELRTLAMSRGWLEATAELPDDQAIAAALRPARRASSTVSGVEPLREIVQRWVLAGVQSRAIHGHAGCTVDAISKASSSGSHIGDACSLKRGKGKKISTR